MPSIRLKGNTVKEGSVCYVRAEFYNRDGAPTTPDTLEYRIDCLTTQTEILGWTSVTPYETTEILITATQNRVIDQANPEEVKQVTVKATGSDGPVLQVERYRVENLFGTT